MSTWLSEGAACSSTSYHPTCRTKGCRYAYTILRGERGGSVVECRTPEREVRGSRPTAAVLCP